MIINPPIIMKLINRKSSDGIVSICISNFDCHMPSSLNKTKKLKPESNLVFTSL